MSEKSGSMRINTFPMKDLHNGRGSTSYEQHKDAPVSVQLITFPMKIFWRFYNSICFLSIHIYNVKIFYKLLFIWIC